MRETLPEPSDLAKAFTPGRYRHYKGGEYEALMVARHSEQPSEEFVIYRSLESGETWARPIGMFFETISTPAYSGPRFRRVEA